VAGSASESWGIGAAYEPFIGRWSRAVAGEFVRWVSPGRGRRWVELGCGTGALTHAILDAATPAHVVATDRSRDYLRYARAVAPGAADPRAVTVSVALPSGEKLEGRLVLIDDFLVSLRLPDATIRTVARKGDVPKVEVHDPMKGHRDLLSVYTDKDIHNVTAYLVTLK